ncbi:MAG: glycyl-radical enzyme activating protein [Bacillota bacterium]|nr:glycyl-radical enzyme activating protein [Bacillota bacterium]
MCETKAFTKVNPGMDTKANIIDFDPTKCIVCGKCAEVCSTESCKLIGKEYTADELIDELNRDMIFYEESGGGVTFSGGEPLLDADFVRDVANEYKKKGISTALETCGQASWNSFNRVMAVIDWFLYDLKFVDEEKHRRYCGHTNEQILSNLIKLCESNEGKIIVRIPIIPGINDSEEELKAKGKFLKQRKHRIHEVHLLPYHNLGLVKYDNMGIKNKMESLVPPDSKYMKKITEILGNFDLTIRIGG